MLRDRALESVPKELEDLFWWVQWIRRNGGGGGSLTPLTRTKFIDAGTSTPALSATGSIGAPYATIQAWLTAIGVPSTPADASNFESGFLSPGTYTESPVFPQYRNMSLKAYCDSQLVTGNITWANGSGGSTPPAGESSAILSLQGLNLFGNITITDNGSLAEGLILSASEGPVATIIGNIIGTGATDLASVTLNNVVVVGNITSTANATGATVFVTNTSVVSGAITCKGVQFLSGASYGGTSITLTPTTGFGIFFATNFSGVSPTISAAGATLNFDGPSWQSFREAGGTTTGIALIVGGFSGGDNPGANLTNADVTVSLNGTGASGGFTGGGNHYTLPAGTLTGPHVVTLGTGGAKVGDTIRISRFDSTAQTYTVKDDAATTIAVLPASSKGFCDAVFNGTHFVFSAAGGGVIT